MVHASSFVHLLQNEIEICLSGGNDIIKTIANILNCDAWDCRSSGNESTDHHSPSPLSSSRTSQKGRTLGTTNGSGQRMSPAWHAWLHRAVLIIIIPSYRATWFKIFHSSRSFQWQNILLLVHLLFTVAVPLAGFERFFSNLGLVNSVKRALLSPANSWRHSEDLL